MIDISQSCGAVFRPDLHRFCLRQGQEPAGAGLAWMNFFPLYVSLPALLFVIMSKTPFAELNNPPFLIATTLGTMTAFVAAMLVGKFVGGLTLREMTLAGLAGA